jgi:ribonuclease HII
MEETKEGEIIMSLNDNYNDNDNNIDNDIENNKSKKTRKPRTVIKHEKLLSCYDTNSKSIEIGIDEAGRGPMLGRVYTAAVILPKDDSYDHSLMKDSKRFHSEKKIKEAAEYIKKNAIMWNVQYAEKEEIDKYNIRNATHKSMHRCVLDIIQRLNQSNNDNDNDRHSDMQSGNEYHLLVDGNDFKPYMIMSMDEGLVQIPHTCIEGGDNKYSAIAAASILAKVARDNYIDELCKEHPLLDERYGLLSNKGYGTKTHMDGIKKYGISQFHRTSFGICKTEKLNVI